VTHIERQAKQLNGSKWKHSLWYPAAAAAALTGTVPINQSINHISGVCFT
jgi:hypothetical protein